MPEGEPTTRTELTPDTIEALIQEGRAPFEYGATTSGKEETVTFFIPPKGTQRGDILTGSATHGFTFTSPEGESRGMAEMHVLPRKEGRLVERKMWDSARAQGVDNSGKISYAFRKARVWCQDNL